MRILFFAVVLAAALPAAAQDIDLDAWHEDHPVAQTDPPPEPRFELGFMPSLALNVGLPNGVAAEGQLYISYSMRGRWSFFTGVGYEVGPLADGGSTTIGWGGVKQPSLEVPTRGFHGVFLRYRWWDQRNHGHHRGLSAGWEHGLGPFGLALELGAARSDRNHWMGVARLSFKVGVPWLWARAP